MLRPGLSFFSRPRFMRWLMPVMGVACLGGSSLRAQFTTWTGAANSTWNAAKNWSPAKVPSPAANISINTNGSRQPVLSGSSGNGNLLYLGADSASGTKTSLMIKSAGKLNLAALSAGFAEAARGILTVTGMGTTLNASDALFLGFNGTGNLTISAGARVNSPRFTASLYPTAHSAAIITGNGSRLTISSNTVIGNGGASSLLIAAGGNLTSRDSVLGYLETGNGTATLTGNGTQWVTSGNFMVGLLGSGSAHVLAGARLQSQFSTLGDIAGSNGTVTVSGAGSRWLNSTGLIVGGYSEALLAIASGGNVTTNDGTLGYFAGAVGNVTVTGKGSQLVVANDLGVGQEGTGTVTVGQGGKIAVGGRIQLANQPGASGTFNLLAGGLLQVGGSNNLHAGTGDYAFNFAGGTLQVVSSVLTSSLQAAFVDNTTSTLDTGPYNSFWLGNLTGGGALRKAGSAALVLSGVNDYAGGTILAAGVLFLDTTTDGYAAGTGPLTTAANTTLLGTSHVGGPATINGFVGPRSDSTAIGRLAFDQDLQLGAASGLYLELAGNGTGGTDYDQIAVAGNLTLHGSLHILLLYTPTVGDAFQILPTGGSITGQFSSLTLPALPAGLGWDVSSLSTSGMLAVYTAPAIETAPASQVKKGGASVTFSVTADGLAPLTYQWYFKGHPIANATSASLTLTKVTKANAGTYTVTVTNGDGHGVTSPAAVLVVDTIVPKIIQQSGSTSITAGHTVKLRVAASGDGPLLYQWRRNQANLANGHGVAGVTTSTLTLANAKPSAAGTYTCVVSNAAGHSVSRPVKLTIR